METLRYVVMVNGLLAVVSLAYYVLLRRETFFGANRLALWLGLIAALILPLVELPDWRPQRVRTVMHRTAQAIVPKVLPNTAASQPNITITFPDGQTFPAFQKRRTSVGWSWQDGLVCLYVLGVLWLLIRLGRQLISLKKLIWQSAHEPYDGFTLVQNEAVTSPFSFFNWVVLNPNQHTSDELEQILRHERVHVRERHSLDMLGAELVCIVFWFNPAAYLFRHLLHQTLEFSADRAVLAEGVDATLYQYNLVKVSLSGGQSIITNHFSRSQLKSRISMLNRRESPNASWLKYPVFFIAALTVASAFARPQHIKALSKYVPKSVAKTITSASELPKNPDKSITALKSLTDRQKPLIKPTTYQFAPISTSLIAKPTLVGLSRYTEIRDNTLFWIITPLTTFDDIVHLKAEFAKYGYRFEIDEMKFDRLHKFLVRMDITITSEKAQSRRTTDDVEENKPMQSFGGQISIIKPGIQGASEIIANAPYPTRALMEVAIADVQAAQNLLEQHRIDYLTAEGLALIEDKKMEYMVLEGKRKYGHLGMGFRRFDKEEIKKQSTPNSAISVKPNGSIVINEAPREIIKTFINNEPVTLDDVQRLKITQLYTVAVILGHDAATNKRTGIDYLLFYIDDEK